MTRRTCPVCQRRYAGLVDPECPVCLGVGVIGLHPVAVAVQDDQPAVVARAIEVTLESTSREAAALLPLGGLRADALAVAAQKLREARVITTPLGVAPDPDAAPVPADPAMQRLIDWEASRMAADHGPEPLRVDLERLDEAPVQYEVTDRPLAGGELPKASAAGFRSRMVMAADPRDPLGPDTQTLVYRDRAVTHRARVFAECLDRAVAARRRRLARPGACYCLAVALGRGRHRAGPGQGLLFVLGLPEGTYVKGSAA